MDKREILNRIIAEHGSCDWASPSVCELCPLSKLKKRDDGNYLGCIEAIGAEELSVKEANAKYKQAAENALLDVEIDSLLETDC